MAKTKEKVPLLHSPGDRSHTAPHFNLLFPPMGNGDRDKIENSNYQGSSISYGMIDTEAGNGTYKLVTGERKLQQPKGFASTSIIAVVAVAVGLVLVLSVASFTASSPGNDGGGGAAGSILSQSPTSSRHVDIEIPQGRLRGYTKLSRQRREYSAFYKIPYAQPPLGSYRFKDPVPPSPWQGLRDYPVVAPQCIQKEKYSEIDEAVGEEDCLYANIYTPRLPENGGKLFPVMVYIHGGGPLNGNGSRYGPDYFMDEDVVIITFQYRLGAFGFLSTGDDVIRGNMGMKDIIQMLRWTQENVQYFNGDRSLVTIFGNSWGGISVGTLMTSPMSSGLFHRAISQSGANLCTMMPSSVNEIAGKKTAQELGKALGCDYDINSGESQKYLDCLSSKDEKDIALVSGPEILYAFTTEEWEGAEEEKFMPEVSNHALVSGSKHIMKVPYLLGNNNAEFFGTAVEILKSENYTNFFNERFDELSETLLAISLDPGQMERVKDFYFGEGIVNDTNSLWNLGNLVSDRQMVHCAYASARYHAQYSNAYLYWLTKPPYLSYMDKGNPGFPAKELGMVSHADELQVNSAVIMFK